jgi:hypothetical protein
MSDSHDEIPLRQRAEEQLHFEPAPFETLSHEET